jgi:hypothetical protein
VEIAGDHHFDAPRAMVWEALLDPKALKASMPGCEKMEPTGPAAWDLTIKVGIAAIKGTYSGTVKLADEKPKDSYRLLVSGSGKPGTVQGDALMLLTDDGAGTLVKYTGEVKAQGAIARLGSRLLAGTAKLMIGQFFKAMEKQVGQRVA